MSQSALSPENSSDFKFPSQPDLEAKLAYRRKCALEEGEEFERLPKTMLAYCEMDTLAMVRILGELVRMGG